MLGSIADKDCSSDSSHLVLLDRHAFFLPLVPVPFVDLALSEGEALGDASDILSGPVGVLFELVLENLQLFLVLSLTTFYVAVRSIAILCLLEQ